MVAIEARRRGLHRLWVVTACLGAASLVGTGGLTLVVAAQAPAAGEVSTGPTEDTTDTGSTAAVPAAPTQPLAPAPPGRADASSGGS